MKCCDVTQQTIKMGAGCSSSASEPVARARDAEIRCLTFLKSANKLHVLGENDPTKFPRDLLDKSDRAISRLVSFVLASYPNGGVGVPLKSPEVHTIVQLLGIDSLMSKLEDRLASRDVRTFCDELVKVVKQNPAYVILAAEMETLYPAVNLDRILTPAHVAELRKAIALAALLDAVGMAYLYEIPGPEKNSFTSTLLALLKAKCNASDGTSYSNTFERMKLTSVKIPALMLCRRKLGQAETNDNKSSPIVQSLGMQANILEAMYQDTLLKNPANASCGLELISHRFDGDNTSVKEDINRDWVVDGQNMGITLQGTAFPEVWDNLYCSWNSAFVMQFPEAPLFLAKLITPVVGGVYHTVHPGLFVAPRVITLHTFICYAVVCRGMKKNRNFSDVKWDLSLWRSTLSRINLAASKELKARVEASLRADEKAEYVAFRGRAKGVWDVVRETTEAYTEADDLFGEAYKKVTAVVGMQGMYTEDNA